MQEYVIQEGSRTGLLRRKYLIGNLGMLVTVLFWGISFINVKIVLGEIPPVTIALIRFAIASLLLGMIFARMEPGTKVEKKDLPMMALAGIMGITMYFYFENNGIKLTTAANAALIVAFVPLITILLDVLFFHSRASWLKVVGVGIAVTGTYFSITANGQISLSSTNFKGNMFMVCAMLVWAFYTLANKSLQRKYSGLCLTTYQTIFGTVFMVPLVLPEMKEWKMFSLLSLGHILFLAVCCSVLGYWFYMYSLKHLDVTVTTIYLNLVPVVGVAGGYLFLQESVLPIQMIGGVLTLLAIFVVNLEVILDSKIHKEKAPGALGK